MNYYAGWKNVLIAFFLFLLTLYALPNIYGSDLAIQISGGGDYIVNNKDVADIEDILKDKDINYKSIGLANSRIMVRFNDSQSQLSSKAILKQTLSRNYVIALNLAPSIPNWLSSIGGKAMSLGLDLRGGVHFLLEVDMDAVVATSIDRYENELRTHLKKDRLYRRILKEDNSLMITFREQNLKDQAKKVIRDKLPNLIIVEGSEGKLQFRVKLSPDAESVAKKTALNQNITTLRNRVNELGVAEPTIQQQGAERIVVQLPGVQDTARAKEILGAVATLEFRLVDEKNDLQTAVKSGKTPSGSKLYYFRDGRPLLLKSSVIVTGENIVDASSRIDQESNSPMVNIVLDNAGGKSMLETTKEYLHHRMAVVFIENKVETIIKDGETIKSRSKTQDIINAATIQGTFSNQERLLILHYC